MQWTSSRIFQEFFMDRETRILAICLGAIAALGPFAMDMYLAAMPKMAADLGAAEGEIELSVMAFFVGFCGGQLVLGPLSDRTGRKPVVYFGLAMFFISSIGCIFAGSVHDLMLWRLLQGIGGSIGMVIAMSSVRDKFSGQMAARMMSMVVIVLGLAPVISPIIGATLLTFGPWQWIFYALAFLSAVVFVIVWRFMPEPRSPEARAQSNPRHALRNYGRLLVNRDFVPYAGAMALTQGGFFAYLSSASVVLIGYYGLTPLEFSAAFAVNAIGLTLMARFSHKLIARYGAVTLARRAMAFRAAVTLVMTLLLVIGELTLPAFLVTCFFFVGSLGLVMPTCSLLALDRQGKLAGTASALMGACGFGFGALGALAVGLLTDGSAMALVVVITVATVSALVLALTTFSDEAGMQPLPASS
jgi:MFS transporter, DHA1 family, multidrug resistance protein